MDLVEVDVVGAEPSEACLDRVLGVFAAEAVIGGSHAVVDLGGEDDVVSLALDGFPDNLFRPAIHVGVGGVKEVDASVDGTSNDLDGGGFLHLLPVNHGAQTQFRHLHTCFT